jgi:hypothetical protein
MGKNKHKNHRGHLPVIDRFAVHYGGCDDLNDPIDEPLTPFDFGKGIRQPLCHHWRQPVEVAQETVVYASAYMDRPRTQDWSWPDVGVYLSERWIEDVPLASFHWAGPVLGPSAQIVVLPCPDGGCPLYEDETERVFAYALNAARAGRFVEVGCHAGHGRTGTALAALMILAGFDAETALVRLWDEFCEFAVESPSQERYLFDFARKLGKETP